MILAIPSPLHAYRKQHMEEVCCVSVQLLVELRTFALLVHKMTVLSNCLIFVTNQIPGALRPEMTGKRDSVL